MLIIAPKMFEYTWFSGGVWEPQYRSLADARTPSANNVAP
jgi:hypothetical protein